MPSSENQPFRSGFVSLVGRPNTGKSTLLNALVGARLAIVADKPQTTRTSIQGVLTLPGAQIVFLDTPGIHRSKSLLNARMMEAVRAALDGRDLLLLVADSTVAPGEPDRETLELLARRRAPVFLVLNKIDRLRDKSALLVSIDRWRTKLEFAECIPISALTGDGIETLKAAILDRLPEGPQYFPSDHITDQPERFLAAEIVREKILRLARQEVPHAVAVLVESWEEMPRLVRIHATVYVERDSQKAILIGARGSMLKRVGTLARVELESLTGRKVFLELFVKVLDGWRDNPAFLKEMDWRSLAGVN